MRRVVIVGAGFGGLTAARELRGADVEVTLVDRVHHHLFQPLLYQVACGGLAAGEIASPIRVLLRRQRRTHVLMAEAVGLDVERRELELDGGERLPYDSLIVACGARSSYFGHEDWREVTCGLKTLADALALRDRLYGALERAERCTDEAERRALSTFVVIGAGPTGVEVAGEIAIVSADTLGRGYERIRREDVRVILLDAGERVIPSFSERLSRQAARDLASLGVVVRTSASVSAIDERGVTIELQQPDGRGGGSTREERIATRTVVWAAGVRAAPFAATLADASGVKIDRVGRVPVEPNLTVHGHPEISLIGDAASLDGPDGRPLPGLATVAIQQARHVARAIRTGAPGAGAPFRYFDKGTLAVVGRGRAVCTIRGVELWGHPAFFTYMTVHMYYLGGVPGKRLKVLIDWATARLGRPQSQVIEGTLARSKRAGTGWR